MNISKVTIKGMHCKSCELLIEDELLKIKGVKKVEVSHRTGEAVMHYEGEAPSNHSVKNAVREAGYELGKTGKLPFISVNPQDYVDLLLALVILVLFYFIGRELGIFNIAVQSKGNYGSLPIVLLVGLTAGISTCMALVGGLVLGVASRFSQSHPGASTLEKFTPHLFFNAGRILSFFLLGGLVGMLGSVFQLSSSILGLMVVAVGAVMTLMGLQLIGIFPGLSNFSITLPKCISRALGVTEADKEYSPRGALLLGAMTFFVPCGFTQAMQLYAMSTGSFLTGGLTMAVFAIGTAPGLLGVGGLTSFMKGQFSKMFFKFAGLVVIALAVFNISNGLNLAGFAMVQKTAAVAQDPNVTIEDGKQVIHMTQNGQGYSPNSITIKKGMPVKWVIKSEDPYTCASSLVAPSLNIRALLTEKEQVFEFTPKEAGDIRFTCSMGMYSGAFHVIEDSSSSSAKEQTNGNIKPDATLANQARGTNGASCGCGQTAQKRAALEADKTPSTEATQQDSLQIIKASYSVADDVKPNKFTVKAGVPVRFDIEAKEDGAGCMGSIMIPGLVTTPLGFEKGKTTTLSFTPDKPGSYTITCAMGVPRGTISVI